MSDFDNATARALEIAAQARRSWEDVEWWREKTDLTDPVAKVTWQIGRAVDGYEIVSGEVSKIVGERLGDFIQEALDRIELRARRSFDEALKS